MAYNYFTADGGFAVSLEARYLGDDLLVTCTGGDRPHIGAVAVGYLAVDPAEHGMRDAASELICLAGHREDELARAAAVKLSEAIGRTVTVVAGLHWDNIDRAGIDQVVANVERLVAQLVEELIRR